MRRKPRSEQVLIYLLRLAGGVTLLAFFGMFLPTPWMAAAHHWLGLGEFPKAPLVDYLTRSISGLYAAHGGFVLLVSRDVRRHRPLVVYYAWLNVLLGAALVAIDLHAGMPWYWTLGEGPPIVAFGLLLAVLVRSVPDVVRHQDDTPSS